MKALNRSIAILPFLATSALAHTGTASHMHVSSSVSIPITSFAVVAATACAWAVVSILRSRRADRRSTVIRD